MDFLNVGLIKKEAVLSVATKGAWYHCRRTQIVSLKIKFNNIIGVWYNITAQIYYKMRNTCALLRKQTI